MCYRRIEVYNCGHSRKSRSPCGSSKWRTRWRCWLQPSYMEIPRDFQCRRCANAENRTRRVLAKKAKRLARTARHEVSEAWYWYVNYPLHIMTKS